MKKEFTIHIPQPCHEDWQQMTPVDKGRFCQSCAKQVVDFSLMSDQQILNYISKAPGRLCGRFADDQLQRPLQPLKQEKKKIWWVAALMPLMMVFGRAGAQKKQHRHNQTENIIKLSPLTNVMGDVVITAGDDEDNREEDNTPVIMNENPVNSILTGWRQKGQNNFTISGKIEEAKRNTPVAYATIYIKGTKTGTYADVEGNF